MTCIQYYSTNEFSNFSFKCYTIMILSDILELSIVYCMIHRYCLYLIFFIVKCVILLFLIFCKKISLCFLRFTWVSVMCFDRWVFCFLTNMFTLVNRISKRQGKNRMKLIKIKPSYFIFTIYSKPKSAMLYLGFSCFFYSFFKLGVKHIVVVIIPMLIISKRIMLRHIRGVFPGLWLFSVHIC